MSAALPAAHPAPGPVPAVGIRPRRGRFWGAVALTAAMIVAGTVIAFRGYAASGGPEGVVRDYFAALRRADAPAALALGRVPVGPRTLLTSTVLREQRRIAPISDLTLSSRRDGDEATVTARYILHFTGAPESVSAAVAVHRTGAGWRLDQVAVPVQLDVIRAAQRASLLGAAVPTGTMLLLPGAVPVAFDSPYLALDGSRDHVDFGADPTLPIAPRVSAAGTKAVISAVTTALRGCLGPAAPAASRCPQRNDRDVPGTLRATIVGSIASALDVTVGSSAAGQLEVTGKVAVRGSYRTLTFSNVAVTKSGRFTVPIAATAFAVAPLKIVWGAGS